MKNGRKLVIIGANEFQPPLIKKKKKKGLETHVFAWEEGAVGRDEADRFYPVSITEKEEILSICREIEPSGCATIGSDLAAVTVNFLTNALGLPGNPPEVAYLASNKYAMRKALREAGACVPFFTRVTSEEEAEKICDEIEYPVIVKPSDRSGSRGICLVERKEELTEAVRRAAELSFAGEAVIEGYIGGTEYSMETFSYEGEHSVLQITRKYTTGAPDYIETGHIEPAELGEEVRSAAIKEILKGLDALRIRNGASHAEFRVGDDGRPRIIEIGARMGGDCIGSDLVRLSTGIDYVGAVVDGALGIRPDISPKANETAGIRFIMNDADRKFTEDYRRRYPELCRGFYSDGADRLQRPVDSGSRHGFLIASGDPEKIKELVTGGRSIEND